MIEYFDNLLFGNGPVGLIAQLIGFVAMGLNFVSFQQKKARSIVILQFFSGILWTVHMLMLGAWAGTLLNVVGTLRAALYACREKHEWARKKIWYPILIGAFGVCSLVSAFQGDEWMALLPFVAMTASTFALSASKSSTVRLLSLLSSPCWLCYNAINASIAGAISEACNLVSIFSGMLRIDLPAHLKAKKERAESSTEN